MPFIGNKPALAYISFAVQHFTTSATTSYTLDYPVANENEIRLVINNVVQQPGSSYAYSATGTTLTLTSATLATDTMYAVFIGKAVQTVTPPANINIQLADGTAAAPSLNFANDTNTGIFRPTTDSIGFAEGGTEAMRITSDGNIGVNTTPTAISGFKILEVKGSTTNSGGILRSTSANGTYSVQLYTASAEAYMYTDQAIPLVFYNSGTERMRIDTSGNVLMGTTNTNPASADINGISWRPGDLSTLSRLGGIPFQINRGTDDGILLNFSQAASSEGNISVSGATVAYNGFTGTHWSRFIDESKPDVLRGTVLESLDQMTDWYNAEFTDSENNLQKKPYALKANEQEGDVITYNFEGTDYQATIVKELDVKHVMSKISDTSEAKNVYGVFHAWDNDDLINNDFYVASVGSYVVRIKAGQTVSKGDLLQSNGDGTAKVQADDIIRASTFAKVLSNTVIQTYEDGSFIVPCSLMC